MRPEEFPEANRKFVKPDSLSDEQCQSLSAWQGKTGDGHAIIITFWKPSYEDLQALKNGAGIYVMTFGQTLPPQSLFVENPFAKSKP